MVRTYPKFDSWWEHHFTEVLMLECLVIGDSIASGVAQARRNCVEIAEVGIDSTKWSKKFSLDSRVSSPYKVVVISLGTNDWKIDNLSNNLADIRDKIKGEMVVWILPSWTIKPEQRKRVELVASRYGDRTLDISNKVGYDAVHPKDLSAYSEIADQAFRPRLK